VTCSGTVPVAGAVIGAELFGPKPLVIGYEVGCSGTTPFYTGVLINGAGLMTFPGPVKAGDVVTAWVKQTVWPKDGKLFNQANLSNLTEGGGYGTGGNQLATLTGAAVGVLGFNCALDGSAPVPRFSNVSFSSVKLNGTAPTGDAASSLRASNGTVEATAAALVSTTGFRFATSWATTCAPDANGHC
jgi:hypothetical protein